MQKPHGCASAALGPARALVAEKTALLHAWIFGRQTSQQSKLSCSLLWHQHVVTPRTVCSKACSSLELMERRDGHQTFSAGDGHRGQSPHPLARPRMQHCPHQTEQHLQLSLLDGQARKTLLWISDFVRAAAGRTAARHHEDEIFLYPLKVKQLGI